MPNPIASTGTKFFEGLSSTCLLRREPDRATLSRSCGPGGNFEPRPDRPDRCRRLCGRTSPLARPRLQPGVRRVPRLCAGRRSAPRRLERVRADRARLPEKISRRDEQSAHRGPRCEQFNEFQLAPGDQDRLRPLYRRFDFLSRDSQSARRRRPDRLRRRSAQLHAPVDAAGSGDPPAPRPGACRASRADRFRQAHDSFSGVSAPPRPGAGDFGLLRSAGADHSHHRAAAISWERSRAVSRARSARAAPRSGQARDTGGSGNPRRDGSDARLRARQLPCQDRVSHFEAGRRRSQRRHGLSPAGHRPSARWRLARISRHSAGEELMGFLTPWFLAGAALVGLPPYLHLLRRHTTTPQKFSSLMFFERRTQSSIRHRRFHYLLLLSLRLALLLLIALAFANPYFKRTAVAAAGDKQLLLVVDDSLSMRAGTRLVDAKREAESGLASRSGSTRAQVATLGSRLQVLTQPIQDSGALRAAVEGIEPGDSRSNFAELP